MNAHHPRSNSAYQCSIILPGLYITPKLNHNSLKKDITLTKDSDFDAIKMRVIFALQNSFIYSLNRYSVTLVWVFYFQVETASEKVI